MAYTLQSSNHKDCVLVSLSNYFGKEYNDCATAALKAGYTLDYIRVNGTPARDIPVIIAHLTGKICDLRHPRRGQNKVTGLGHFVKTGKAHLAPIIDGVVYDTNGLVLGIEAYKRWHGYALRGVYCNV